LNDDPSEVIRMTQRSDSVGNAASLSVLRDVEVEVTLEIGRKRMKIGELLRLGTGKTLELEKAAGEPLEIVVNGRVIGRGEAIVVGDRYGIRITQIMSADESEGT